MKNSTKLLRFRYMLPLSLLIMFDLILITYAAIVWDSDPSNIWHGPKNAPYTDATWEWSSNGWDDSYECPPTPAPTKPPPTPCSTPPCPGGGTGSPTDPPTSPPTSAPIDVSLEDTLH